MDKRLKLLTVSAILTSAVTSLIPMTQANATIVEGAKYYYTLDGSDPTTSSTRIEWTDTSSPQEIIAPDTDEESTVTVKVVAVKDGFTNSDVVEKTITFAAKKVLMAPILDPSTSQTFPNRDTDNYFYIKNNDDDGVNYYYTIDGTVPSVDNGTLIVDKAICLNGPDVDSETVYNLKVIAEKDGEYSAVTSTRVTYLAGTNIAQTLLNVKQQIISAFESSSFNENTEVSEIEALIVGAIALDDTVIKGSCTSFENTNGHIIAEVNLRNIVTNDSIDFELNKNFCENNTDDSNGTGSGSGSDGTIDNVVSGDKVEIEESGDQYVDEVANKIKNYLDKYTPTNESEESTIDDELQHILNATTSAGVTVELKDWHKTEATSQKKGVLQFIVDVFNDLGDKAKVTFDKFISKLPGGDTDSDNGNSNGNIGGNGGTGSGDNADQNETDFDKAVSKVKSYLNKLEPSNSTKKSTVTKKIEDICDDYGVDVSITGWDLDEATKSSKGNLSFRVKLTKGDKFKTLEYDEQISRLSSSNSSGSSSSGSSSSNKGESTGSVVAVYKHEPITGKYIRLPDEFMVNGAYTQFNSEVNTEYFIAEQELRGDLVLQEGWNVTKDGDYYLEGLNLVKGWKLINGNWYFLDDNYMKVENNWKFINNKWYYLGNQGVMATGWISYNNNWYYLNTWSGDMATGWKQVGQHWYYLHEATGAMETGWKQLSDGWYYLHSDGHMAKEEYVDGYYLNTQGRWTM